MRRTRRGQGPVEGERASRSRPELVLAGRAWLRGRLQPVEIGIGDDGRISRVARSVPGGERHDVGERIILPSATDLHVHFRDPGPSKDLESFDSGTVQAALGGVGLVGDMPNTMPPVTDGEILSAKAARAKGRLAVDVLLYGLASSRAAIRRLRGSAGAFKLYESPTAGVGEPPDPAALGPLVDEVARTGLPLSVHAEAPDRFRTPPDRGSMSPVDWDAERPGEAEELAVERLLPAPPTLRLHVAHVTSRTVAERLHSAGHSFEATPHHLLLSTEHRQDARFKVNPPLRSEAERVRLWEAFRWGLVPILASDHAPHALEDKARPFPLAPSGMPGVETLLPLLLAQVRAGELELSVLLRAACDRPARWFGVPQGRIAVGHRANLVVLDFRQPRKITARSLHAPCGWTAFEGWEGVFPVEHYREGRLIVEGGEFVGDRSGSVRRPEYSPGPGEGDPSP